MQLEKDDIIFQNWKVKDMIGTGSFGAVYEIEREEFGRIYRAAAKVISIPSDADERLHLVKEGMTEKNIIEYYQSMVENIVSECDLMARMRGDSHIVSYEDHYVEQSDNGEQWTIYIRMELLKPLGTWIAEHGNILEEEVIRLGMDICRGLETCEKFNVIHRDIKPENIFVSDTGHYKLGDFGISKIMEKSEKAVSQKGTRLYMAPEIFRGEKYNATVDIYSLGLVLFGLMNHNRAPFLPAYPETIRIQDKEKALLRRMAGEEIPDPCNAGRYFSEIIRKACSFYPEKRYQKPEKMRESLENLLGGEDKRFPFSEHRIAGELSETLCVQEKVGIHSLYSNRDEIDRKKKKRKNKVRREYALSVMIAVIVIVVFFINGRNVIKENENVSGKQIRHSTVTNNEINSTDSGDISSKTETEEKTETEKKTEVEYIRVPKVTGLTETEAVERLIEAGYSKDKIEIAYKYSDLVESGFVITQSVLEEIQVEENSIIILDVSLGTRPVPATTQSRVQEEESEWIWKALD